MNISSKILSDPVMKWLFQQGRGDIYLVGGYIRDLLRGRRSKDKDFVYYGDAAKLAERAARKFNGTFILLKEGLTCRVALKDKSIIDINYLNEPLEADLKRRDFTVNTMSWSPDTGLLDPLNGLKDIEKGLIKVVDPENLKDDPLRVLRAYRLAAELNFRITGQTRKELKEKAGRLISTAPERVTEELIRLFNQDSGFKFIKMSIEDDVLSQVFGVDSDKLTQKYRLLKRYDYSSKALSIVKKHLDKELGQGLTRSGLIRFAALFDRSDLKDIENTGLIRLSRVNNGSLKRVLTTLAVADSCRLTQKNTYKALQAAGENAIEAAILLGLKKRVDAHISVKKGIHYLNILNKALISGNDIQNILNTGPGPKTGEMLENLNEARFLGKIKTRKQALSYIIEYYG